MLRRRAMAPTVIVVEAAGDQPARLRSTGPSRQRVRLDWQMTGQTSTEGSVTDESAHLGAELIVDRRAEEPIATVMLEVGSVEPLERTVDGTPVEPERPPTTASEPGMICLLQGPSGLLTLNSDATRWPMELRTHLQIFLNSQMAVFPDQPVGVHGTWRYVASRDADGARDEESRLTTLDKLDALDGTTYTVSGSGTVHRAEPDAETMSSVPTSEPDVVETTFTYTASGRTDRAVPGQLTITRDVTWRSPQSGVERHHTETVTITELSAD